MERFEFLKKQQFRHLDKSDEGHVDKKILPLIKKINSKKDYYTTSSCSGRIVLIKGKEKKQEGLYLFKSHERISSRELKEEMQKAAKEYHGLIYSKMESCIMHIACSSLERAQSIVNKAKLAGWKNSGIIATESNRDRIVCEIASTERIALPIINKGKILVSDNFLKLLASESNKKLARTWEKIKKLEKIIKNKDGISKGF
jgi:tRNA wybutosine-synthesizing protein 3